MGVLGQDDDGHARRLLPSEDNDFDRLSEGSSDFDIDEENFLESHPEHAYKRAPRRRQRQGWRWERGNWTVQCSTINRKQKLLIFALTLLLLLLSCAAVYSKKHGIPKLKPVPKKEDKKPPPPPKPTFCSTWPIDDGKHSVGTRDEGISQALVERSELETRSKWTKPNGFKIVATVFCEYARVSWNGRL